MSICKEQINRLFAIFAVTSIFLSGFLFCQRAFGANIDPNLLKWDPTYYKKLLGKLDSANATSDEVLLQKTLLQRLIYFSSSKPEAKIDIPEPTNQKEYLDLFSKFVSWAGDKAELAKKIDESKDNLEVLKNQIELLPDKSPKLLTLELQYAFYKKSLEFYQERLSALSQAIKQTPKIMVKALPNISLDLSKTRKMLDKNGASLNQIEAKIRAARIEQERLNLLQRNDKAAKLEKIIEGLEKQRKKLLTNRLGILFLKFSFELKNKNKTAFDTGSRIMELAKALQGEPELSNDIAQLLNTMETLIFGMARTFHLQALQEIKLLVTQFFKTINEPIFSIDGTPISIMKLFMAIAALMLGFVFGNIYKKNINRISLANRTLTQATRTLLANLGYYAIVILGFLTGLKVVGIDLSSFALVAGALTVGIGFGLQNIVANFVSGIILMFERSVKIGDYIEFDEKLRGRVVDIRMRSMTINTNANIDIIVPNQDFIQQRVINWTMKDKIRRFDIPFSTAYGTDPQRVADVVLGAINKCKYTQIHRSPLRQPSVILKEMGDSSLNFYLRIWINGPDITRPNATTSMFLLIIYKALTEAGIEIPFPQRDIHLRSVEKDILLNLTNRRRREDMSEGIQTVSHLSEDEGKISDH